MARSNHAIVWGAILLAIASAPFPVFSNINSIDEIYVTVLTASNIDEYLKNYKHILVGDEWNKEWTRPAELNCAAHIYTLLCFICRWNFTLLFANLVKYVAHLQVCSPGASTCYTCQSCSLPNRPIAPSFRLIPLFITSSYLM